MNDLISVVTTVKNGEQYLEETLKSVYNQTYSNYEHVIIDDGSTDNTWEVVQNFQNNHKSHHVKAIKTEGVGRAKALNLGVENAKGDWIAIIDADDLWHPKKLEIQSKYLEKHADIDVLGTGADFFKSTVDINLNLHKEDNVFIIDMQKMAPQCCLTHSSALIKKEYCNYNESRKAQVDYDLWLRLLARKKKLVRIEKSLTFKRLHENQSFESKMGKKFRWDAFKLQAPYILKEGMYLVLIKRMLKLGVGTILPKSMLRKYQLRKIK